MRIIGGEARGRRLYAPDGTDTRPTADKTRESLFNILAFDIPGAYVLDLFGGTGALALEALSRGAEFACVSDISPQAVRCMERNAETVLGQKKNEKIKILKADYKKAVAMLSKFRFDIVFLDPPYKMQECYKEAVRMLNAANMLTEDAVIIMEHKSGLSLSLDDDMEIYDTRIYRDTAIDFVRRRQKT